MSDEIDLQERTRIIIDQYGGIYPVFMAFYVEAIFYAADRAHQAFNRFFQNASAGAPVSEIVANVHEALGHAAALSRFFFPVEKKPLMRARAAKLRQIFSVSNSSALRDRELRNALEHFDERLDEYLLGDIAGYIFPGPLVDDADLADDELGHIFRLVDPSKEIFVLLGQKHPFGSMRTEVDRIMTLAEGMR